MPAAFWLTRSKVSPRPRSAWREANDGFRKRSLFTELWEWGGGFMNFSINLFHFVVDALGNNRLGNPYNTSCRPVICSLIDESVAQRKTPMLDLAPIHVRRVLAAERPPYFHRRKTYLVSHQQLPSRAAELVKGSLFQLRVQQAICLGRWLCLTARSSLRFRVPVVVRAVRTRRA